VQRALLVATGAFLLASGVFAAGPHEHGVVKLDVAVEGNRVSLLMDSPLANLVGFERAPRTDAERQRVDTAIAALQAAATLFRVDAAAGCAPGPVSLNASALEGQQAGVEAGHADIDASYAFKCGRGVPGFIDVRLFEAFPSVQRIDVQLVTNTGQAKRTLTRAATRLTLKP
jgi:hypothetical protein